MSALAPAVPQPYQQKSHNSLSYYGFLFAVLVLIQTTFSTKLHAGTVTGSLQKWAPLTIELIGPEASETATNPNPFLDYRLTVSFTSPSGNRYDVPGFFAGNGSGGGTGNRWQARFAADELGQWRYNAEIRSGTNVAIETGNDAGSNYPINDASGTFTITQQSADAPGFLRYGRLEYNGEHYLKFSDGPYWIKSGTDSPENFLGYNGIDGTVDQGGSQFLHDYLAHRTDARDDDPLFSNAETGSDSLGITGALNYLSEQGVNSIYFLPMNLGGDGQETFPFVGGDNTTFNKTHYDISKLHQWNQVLNHAQRRGIALNIQLSETEPGNERWLDNGQMGTERKLFFRELIARFGYLLAAKWNLGEENDYAVSELRAHASYIAQLDWTQKPITVHTQINNFRDYEQIVGDELFSATSIQYDPPKAGEFVETWRKRSTEAGRKWVIDMDENTGGVNKNNASIRRKELLYDIYFSGGNLEWYFGYHPLPLGGDLTAGDFRQREATWETMRYARLFMETELPFWRMQPADELVSGENNAYGGAEVFAAENEVYAIYLPNASGAPTINLSGASGSFSLRWFNPRNGQYEGQTTNIVGGQTRALGTPPSASSEDWVVLVKSHNAPALPDFAALANQTVLPQSDTADNATDEGATQINAELLDDAIQAVTANDDAQDENTADTANEPPTFNALGDLPAAQAGSVYRFSVSATDAEGIAPVITARTLPSGMFIDSVVDGVIQIEWQVPVDASDAVSFELLAIDVQDENVIVRLPITIRVDAASNDTNTDSSDTESSNTDQQSASSEEATTQSQADEPQAEAQTVETQSTEEQTTNTTADEMQSSEAGAEDSVLTAPPIPAVALAQNDLPPTILGAENLQILVGETYRRTIVPIDPEGIVASLRISALPGDSTFKDNGNGTRDFVWTPTRDDIGEHELRFIATDSGQTPHVVQEPITLEVVEDTDDINTLENGQVEETNYAPLLFPLKAIDVRVDSLIEFVVRPIDPDGVPPILHVKSPPRGASFTDNGDGSRTFRWTATEDYIGDIELMFIATDSEDSSMAVEQTMVLTVTR